MGYRDIEINGEKFKYVVGDKFLKIKGMGVFDKHQVGELVAKNEWDLDGAFDLAVAVKPSHVRDVIIAQKRKKK